MSETYFRERSKFVGETYGHPTRLALGRMASILFLSLCCSNHALATPHYTPPNTESTERYWQQKSISGKVTDDQGRPLSGVTITVKGVPSGTTSDAQGLYEITVQDDNPTLVFSYLGFEPLERAVGSETVVNVSLRPVGEQINEVVVTALGIRRQKKSLGYSTTNLKGDEFTESRDPNLGNALSGKVAGVSVSGNSTGMGGSSRVVIRGNSSLTGNNQPLYVIDGIPMDNTNQGNAGQYGGMDMGDGLNNINPDDIQDIQILKGAAASALYGYRGGNGVIMITTKSGKGQSGLGIEVNNNFTLNSIYDYREFQNEYGQGVQGTKPVSADAAIDTYNQSWGARMDGSEAVNILGNAYPYRPIDNWKNFYRTGLTNQTSLAVSGSDEKSSYRLGINNAHESAILPNAQSNQRGLNLNTTYRIAPRVELGLNANYVFEFVDNRANISDGNGNTNATLLYLANSYDVRWLEPAVDGNGQELKPGNNVYFNNPYFLQYRKSNNSARKRLTGGINLRYDITDWLYAQGAMTRDGYNFIFKQIQPKGAAADPNGFISEFNKEFEELNFNYLIGANTTINDFSISGSLGGNIQNTKSQTWGTDGGIRPFIIPGYHSTGNVAAGSRLFKKQYQEFQVNSLYGTAEFGFRDFLFLNLTGRNDWFSTLSPQSNSYFYPSASLSYVFSDHLSVPSWLSMGKLRLAYAAASNGTDPYRTQMYYQSLNFELNGQPLGTVKNDAIPNDLLKPVQIEEYEVGTSLEFLGNRFGLDLSLYRKETTDDIAYVTTSNASGFTSAIQNIGEIRNQGVEALLYGDIVRSDNFKWHGSVNFGFNDSEVRYLGQQSRISIDGAISNGGNASIQNIIGLSYGQIVGYKYKTDEQGNRVYNADGLPIRSDNLEVLGSGVYRFTGGFRNEFTYKNFRLSLLLDTKLGAKLFSGTNLNLYGNGLHQNTVAGRESGIVGEGVTETGEPNTQSANAQVYWKHVVSQGITEEFVYDASFVKLRELSLSYNIPTSLFGNIPIKGASLSLVGRNLWTIFKNTPNIDPESSINNTNGQGLELNGYPYTRNFGFNLNVKF